MLNNKAKNLINYIVHFVYKLYSQDNLRYEVSNRNMQIASTDFSNKVSKDLNLLVSGSESYVDDLDNANKKFAKNNFACLVLIDNGDLYLNMNYENAEPSEKFLQTKTKLYDSDIFFLKPSSQN